MSVCVSPQRSGRSKFFSNGAVSLALFLFAHNSTAALITEIDGIYYSAQSKNESTDAATKILAGAFLGANYRKFYFLGLRYDYFSTKIDQAAAGTNVRGSSYGGRFGVTWGKTRTVQLSAVYYPYVKAALSRDGTKTGDMRGSGYQAELVLAPPISERSYLGVKFIYRSISYNNLVTPSNESQDVSYRDSDFLPALLFGTRFE